MERYKLILAYDGKNFVGSQRQTLARTVQGELEKSLRNLGWDGKSIILAGRTDTGVHASGQVAAVDLTWRRSPEELRKALNASLPPDIAVREAQLAKADFHPRFDAIGRQYEYRLFCQSIRDPLREHHAWRVHPKVDLAFMQSAANEFVGNHDFSAFGSPTTSSGSTQRTVSLAEWSVHADEYRFNVRADAFLYRMVRRMVYIQVAAGQGRLEVESIRKALTGNIKLPSGLAPANGLTLTAVFYSE